MIKNISCMLAFRYLWSANRDPSIATMVRICFLGIFLGALSLTLVFCVMHGFELATKEKLQSIHPMVMIRSDEPLNFKKISSMFAAEFPAIIAAAPTAQQYVMIKDSNKQSINTIILLKGIDPLKEPSVTSLDKKIVNPEDSSLPPLLQNNQIIIGKKLAEQLELDPEDRLILVYTDDKNTKFHEVDVIISGLFNTGIEEFDTNLALCNLIFFNELFPKRGVTEIGLKVKDNIDENKLMRDLTDRLDLEVVAWHELYPALVSALKLEKYAMFFIIALITLVASMNIISLLFMQITQKRGNIAILKACGLPFNKIRSIFLFIGIFIGIVGSILGLMCAFIIGIILKSYPFIQLPDVYYTTHLPIALNPSTFVLVFCVVVILVFIATLIPLCGIKKINIADVLRFEG